MNEALTDIVGNTISEGDTVVYPQMSGRSVQMVRGIFKGYNGTTAQVLRVAGSRWSATYPETPRYRDKRTGKGIDPFCDSRKHYKVKPTYTHKGTGEVLTEAEFQKIYTWLNYQEFTYNEGELCDYVEEYTPEPKPVSIQNVSNIIKVVSPL